MSEKDFWHPVAVIEQNAKIGFGTRIWAFSNIKSGAFIGSHCNICDHCYVEGGAVIGDRVTIKNGVSVFKGITIEDDVFCGTNVVFINDRNPRSRKKDWVLEKTVVKKGAAIGSNATVLCGVTIGEYALIGAGSVVTRDVAAYSVVAGNPARFKGFACVCGKTLNDTLICSCGRIYKKNGRNLTLQK